MIEWISPVLYRLVRWLLYGLTAVLLLLHGQVLQQSNQRIFEGIE
jgi:hypothetical protein